MPQTTDLDLGFQRYFFHLVSRQAGDLAWHISVRIIRWVNERTVAGGAGPAQMGCLKFWPAKRALSPSSSSILWESEWKWTVYWHGGISWRNNTRGVNAGFQSQLLFSHLKYVHVFRSYSPEQLVVLGQALRSARCTCLDLVKEENNIQNPVRKAKLPPEVQLKCF